MINTELIDTQQNQLSASNELVVISSSELEQLRARANRPDIIYRPISIFIAREQMIAWMNGSRARVPSISLTAAIDRITITENMYSIIENQTQTVFLSALTSIWVQQLLLTDVFVAGLPFVCVTGVLGGERKNINDLYMFDEDELRWRTVLASDLDAIIIKIEMSMRDAILQSMAALETCVAIPSRAHLATTYNKILLKSILNQNRCSRDRKSVAKALSKISYDTFTCVLQPM